MRRLTIALALLSGLALGACSDDSTSDTPDGSTPPADASTVDAAPPDPDSLVCIDVDHDGHCRELDCDDENPDVGPGQAEVCGNGLDDNCDGQVDEGCLAGTTEYFVDTDSIGGTCDDSNPGTLTQPWCTLAQANSVLVAGDTVYLRAGTYTGETVQPVSSGSDNETRITYSAYQDEEVILTASVYCIRLQDVSFVTVLGLRLYDCERNLYIRNGHDNNVGYCDVETPMGPTTWAGSGIYDNSTHNRIYNNRFSRYGAESNSSGSPDDSGVILDIGNDNDVDDSNYNLIVNNDFSYGGHHILGVYSSYNVVRGNTFHNEEWYSCHRSDIGGLCGNRSVILNSSQPERNIRNVIEGNWIVFSGVPPDNDTSTGLSVRTQHNIVRLNFFYHNDSSGVALSCSGGNYNDASHNHIFHNVFFQNGFMLWYDWDPEKSGLLLARWVDSPDYNDMVGVVIKNNIFHDNALDAIYYYYVDEADQEVAGNWLHEGDPGFRNVAGEPAPDDFGFYDFKLEGGSPCRENGVFLTHAVTDGTDSTVLEVEDAGYFSDGHEVVEADMIRIEGNGYALLITAVDYATNTLTLSEPRTWTAGAGVSLPYFNAVPDQGAYQHP